MANAVAKVDQFKGIMGSATIKAQLQHSLKENAGAFLSSMLDLYSGDTFLQQCDPELVARECMKAASLNLPIVKSLGFAYVVPFKGVPTFIVGYKGLIQLAQRSGQYKTIHSDVVYEGELVGVDKLSGTIDLSGQRKSDKVIGYFAYFKLVNGFEKTLYMSKEDVEAYGKKYSPSYGSAYSPWKGEFDKMGIKTVLRQLIKTYGIMSSEIQTAFDSDEENRAKSEITANANKRPLNVNQTTGEVLEDLPEIDTPTDDLP